MTLARVGFAFYFSDVKSLTSDISALRRAFFLGFRFDLMPLAYITAIPFLIIQLAYFLPGKITVKISRTLIITVLTLGYFILGWLYVFDYSFYSYYQDHLNILFFGLFEDDTRAVLLSIWKNYNLPLWLTFIFISHYGCYRFIKLMFSLYEFDLKVKNFDWKIPATFLTGLILIAFFARGTFNRLPLSVEDSHVSSNDFINELSLNGALTLNRAIKIRKTFGKGEFNYLANLGFKSWQDAFTEAYGDQPKFESIRKSLTKKTPILPAVEQKSPHVVMLVMESFGTSWNEEHKDDFNILGGLEKDFKNGILFKNFLPAENGTIGSIVSIATSQVIRPGARFLSESEFMGTALSSAGHLPYKNNGYETHFIYGGKLGWRDLGKYLKTQNYDHLWGADEMKESMPELGNFEERELGNEWGIFDEYLYSFIEEQIRTATKPQFFLVMTTSNHPPFEYPSSYKELPLTLTPERLAKITLNEDLARKRFLALQYANQKVSEFIGRVRQSSASEDVIIGLTGDHSYWVSKGIGLEEDFKRFAVPFFLSVPERLKPSGVDTSHFGSHEDIFPTLYHLSLSNKEYVSFGDNLLTDDSLSVNSSGHYASKVGAFHHGEFWKWKDLDRQVLERSEATPELLKLKRKAEGLIGLTDAYLKEEKLNTPSDEDSDLPE